MTTENIQINVREDGSREVVVNINRIADASEKAAQAVDFLTSTFKRLVGVFSAGYLLKQFVDIADTMTLMDARLKTVTKSTYDYIEAQKQIYEIAQKNNVGLKETTQLYTRLYDPIKRLGGGTKEVAAIVDSFSTSLRLSGASQREAASATLQFAQAMGSGKLQGDEFRSLAENAPRFMQTLADSLNVPTGALKAMSSEGKLTADVIGNALIKSFDQLQKEAVGMSNTVGGALSDLKNDTLVTVAAFDKMTGASHTMADMIQGVSLVVFELGKAFKEDMAEGSKLVETRVDAMSVAIRVAGTILETLIVLGSDISFVFKGIGREIGGVAAQLVALAKGDFDAVGQIRKSMVEDAKTAREELDRFQARILSSTDKALEAREKMNQAATTGAQANLKAVASEKDVIETRMRLVGINKSYFEDIQHLQQALDGGLITQKEYVNLMSELATKTYAASKAGKDAAKGMRGADDRLKVMQDALVQEQTLFDREKTIFDNRMHMIEFYHKNFNTEDADYYAQRQSARAEFLASEQKSYEKERDTIEQFKPKTAKEVADQKTRLDKLLQQHLEFIDKFSAVRTDDELSQLAENKKIISASDDATNTYLSNLQKQIDKLNDANDARDESTSAVQYEKAAVLDVAIAYQEQFMAQQLLNGATQEELDQAPKILKYLQDQRKLRGELAEALQTKEIQKANKEYENAVNATSRKIQDSLYAAIIKGGSAGFKKLRDDVKEWFARLILSPIIQPISQVGAQIVQGAFGTSGKGAEAGASPLSLISAGKSLYTAITGGFAGLAADLGGMVSGFGNLIGSSGISAFGSGMGMTGAQAAAASEAYGAAGMSGTGSAITSGASAGAVAQVAGGVAAGLLGGKALSGGYSVIGKSGNASVMLGTALGTGIGAYLGGTAGATLGALIGGLGGGAVNRLFGHKAPQITAQGLRGTIGTGGVTGQAYTDILEKGGVFRSDKRYTETKALTDDITNSLASGLSNVKMVTEGFAKSLGITSNVLQNYTKQFDVAFGTDQAKNAEAITNLFKQIGDEMATQLIPNIAEFAKYGESASQTLERLNNTFVATNALADVMGKTITQIWGDIGLASEKARTRLVDLFGGLDQFVNKTSAYQTAFLTDAEKLAPVQARLNQAMNDLGVVGITTKDQFKNLVNSLDLTTEAGAKMFASLMDIAPAFAQITDATEKLTQAQLEQANATKQAKMEADKLFAQGLLDNLKGAFDTLSRSIGAEKDRLTKAYESRDAMLSSQIDAVSNNLSMLKSVSSAVQSSLDSMKLTESALYDRMQAQGFIKGAITDVRAGKTPDSQALQSALSTISQNSEDLFSSAVDYRRDFYMTANDLYDLGQAADAQASIQQQMLDSLNGQRDQLKLQYEEQISKLDEQLAKAQEQVDLLNGINTSVLSVKDALSAFTASLSSAMANPIASSAATITGAYQQFLGRAPESTGMQFWQQRIEQGTPTDVVVNAIKDSTEAQIRNLYLQLLGREPDATGMAFYHQGVLGGSSMESVRTGILNSAEYASLHPVAAPTNNFFDSFAVIEALNKIDGQMTTLNKSAASSADSNEATANLIDSATAGGTAMLTQDISTL